ncbi:MAG: hypothetical protein EHM70_20810 [Chloroflexota bacterium]|nr:MAG: hypothetical protein EHM70_20810 [Chloroflexota bacterium]
MIGSQDFRKARTWLEDQLAARRSGQERRGRALGQLFQARERARQRQTRTETTTPPPSNPVDLPPEAPAPSEKAAPGPTPKESSTEDTLGRLRQAKKRARK